MVSLFTFVSPVSSSMIAPAALSMADDFGGMSSMMINMTISVFVLAYGPCLLDHDGRHYSNVDDDFSGRTTCKSSFVYTRRMPIAIQVLGPTSELFGRVKVLQFGNLFFLGTVISPTQRHVRAH